MNCYACKRPLTNPESIQAGIGPICRAKRQREQDAQQKLDREAMRCHQGFCCLNPEHVPTLVARLWRALCVSCDWVESEESSGGRESPSVLLESILERARKAAGTIVSALGLDKPQVDVPTVVHISPDEMLRVTEHAFNPANQIAPGECRIPPNLGEQFRRTILREKQICPFGLDCQEPNRAVAAAYQVLSILKNEVEPIFADTSYGGLVAASDAAYVACANTLEVLGLDDEGYHIHSKDLPALRKRAQQNARRWERRVMAAERAKLRRESA